MNDIHWSHAIFAVDGKLVVAGGYTNGGASNSIETMNNDGTWTKLPFSLSSKAYYLGSTCVPPEDFPCKV